MHTGIGSSLPIPCRSPLLHTFHTRSIVVFCIGKAMPIRRVKSDSEIQPIHSWIWRFAVFLSIYMSNWLARLGWNQVQSGLGVRGSWAWCVIISRQQLVLLCMCKVFNIQTYIFNLSSIPVPFSLYSYSHSLDFVNPYIPIYSSS